MYYIPQQQADDDEPRVDVTKRMSFVDGWVTILVLLFYIMCFV